MGIRLCTEWAPIIAKCKHSAVPKVGKNSFGSFRDAPDTRYEKRAVSHKSSVEIAQCNTVFAELYVNTYSVLQWCYQRVVAASALYLHYLISLLVPIVLLVQSNELVRGLTHPSRGRPI